MKNDKDFEIQQALDKKIKDVLPASIYSSDMQDLESYKLLYEQLAKEPVEHLSLSFKSDVLRRIKLEEKKTSDRLFYWMLLAIAAVGALAISLIFFAFKDTFILSLAIIDKWKGFVAIGITSILIFTAVERKLLKAENT